MQLRHTTTWMRVAKWHTLLFARMSEARVVDSATAAAFWLFLSLLPIAAVAAMIVARIATADVSLLQSLFAVIPASSRDLVAGELAHVAAWKRGTVGPVSALVFVWLASSGVHGLLDAFDATTKCTRAWWRKRVLSVLVCAGLSVGVAAVSVIVGAVDRGVVASIISTLAHGHARFVVAFVVELALIAALFRVGIAPAARREMRLFPGVIVAATLHSLLAYGYVVYIKTLGTGSAYEAGLAAIGVTMTVLFLFTLSLLIGVAVNAVLVRPAHAARVDTDELDLARAEGEGMLSARSRAAR